MSRAERRLAALERKAPASGAVAVIDAIGKELEQVERELAELERRLPASQMVIILDR